MENTNEDIDIAEYDLKDFLTKNDAALPEGETFDTIMEKRITPTTDRRKLEAKTLVQNSIAYMEDMDYRMGEICTNIINFYREFSKKLDTNRDKLKQTEVQFQVDLAQCGDTHDDITTKQEETLAGLVEEMKRAIHHVALNAKLEDCFGELDDIQKTYRSYNSEYVKIVQQYPNVMNQFFCEFEANVCLQYKLHPVDKREEI